MYLFGLQSQCCYLRGWLLVLFSEDLFIFNTHMAGTHIVICSVLGIAALFEFGQSKQGVLLVPVHF